MKNNKGFTLVEVLATVTIMAILMLIAVPSIVNLIEKNKEKSYINDAKKLVALAKSRMYSEQQIIKPTLPNKNLPTNHPICIAFTYKGLVKEEEISKTPEGGTYNLDDDDEILGGSFVVVRKVTENNKTKYIYGVQLVEKYTKNNISTYKGIKYVSNIDNITAKDITSKKENFLAARTKDNSNKYKLLEDKTNYCKRIIWYQ